MEIKGEKRTLMLGHVWEVSKIRLVNTTWLNMNTFCLWDAPLHVGSRPDEQSDKHAPSTWTRKGELESITKQQVLAFLAYRKEVYRIKHPEDLKPPSPEPAYPSSTKRSWHDSLALQFSPDFLFEQRLSIPAHFTSPSIGKSCLIFIQSS